MAHWLNKLLVGIALSLLMPVQAQNPNENNREQDYKNPDQFVHFGKRRKAVSAWQVHQLHTGALVVKLRTNQRAIQVLRNEGQLAAADQKMLETAAMNKSLMLAFLKTYTFSKVYFIYSHSSDSLYNGLRKGIFLDTSLAINTSIVMNESFYLIAESDRIYNSSIGFVNEAIAEKQIEKGNPSGGDALIVVKNKYGHQLKKPFPFSAGNGIVIKKVPAEVPMILYGTNVVFNVGQTNKVAGEEVYSTFNGRKLKLQLPKTYSPEIIEMIVSMFNYDLLNFYQRNAPPVENSPMHTEVKPFLY